MSKSICMTDEEYKLFKFYVIDKQENKMTREEAIEKIKSVVPAAKYNKGSAEDWVNSLEALGLIKFDVEIDPIHEIIYEARIIVSDTNKKYQYAFIKRLNDAGYIIVKKPF